MPLSFNETPPEKDCLLCEKEVTCPDDCGGQNCVGRGRRRRHECSRVGMMHGMEPVKDLQAISVPLAWAVWWAASVGFLADGGDLNNFNSLNGVAISFGDIDRLRSALGTTKTKRYLCHHARWLLGPFRDQLIGAVNLMKRFWRRRRDRRKYRPLAAQRVAERRAERAAAGHGSAVDYSGENESLGSTYYIGYAGWHAASPAPRAEAPRAEEPLAEGPTALERAAQDLLNGATATPSNVCSTRGCGQKKTRRKPLIKGKCPRCYHAQRPAGAKLNIVRRSPPPAAETAPVVGDGQRAAAAVGVGAFASAGACGAGCACHPAAAAATPAPAAAAFSDADDDWGGNDSWAGTDDEQAGASLLETPTGPGADTRDDTQPPDRLSKARRSQQVNRLKELLDEETGGDDALIRELLMEACAEFKVCYDMSMSAAAILMEIRKKHTQGTDSAAGKESRRTASLHVAAALTGEGRSSINQRAQQLQKMQHDLEAAKSLDAEDTTRKVGSTASGALRQLLTRGGDAREADPSAAEGWRAPPVLRKERKKGQKNLWHNEKAILILCEAWIQLSQESPSKRDSLCCPPGRRLGAPPVGAARAAIAGLRSAGLQGLLPELEAGPHGLQPTAAEQVRRRPVLRYVGSDEEHLVTVRDPSGPWRPRLAAAGCPDVSLYALQQVRKRLLWFVRKFDKDARESCVCRYCGTMRYLVNRLRTFTGNSELTVSKVTAASTCEPVKCQFGEEMARDVPPTACLASDCASCDPKRTAANLFGLTAAQAQTRITYTTYEHVSEAKGEETVKKWREVRKQATAGEVVEELLKHLPVYLKHRERVIWQYCTTDTIRRSGFTIWMDYATKYTVKETQGLQSSGMSPIELSILTAVVDRDFDPDFDDGELFSPVVTSA